jgi:hypothetical protein
LSGTQMLSKCPSTRAGGRLPTSPPWEAAFEGTSLALPAQMLLAKISCVGGALPISDPEASVIELLLSDAGCIKWVNYRMTRFTRLLTLIQFVAFPTFRVLDSLRP